MKAADALAGMIAAPVTTSQRIAREGANPFVPLGLLVLAVALVEAKTLQRYLFLVSTAGAVMGRRIWEVFVSDLQTHAAVLAGTVVVVATLSQVLAKGSVRLVHATDAAVYLLVPLLALVCVGGFLDGVGLSLWWLPHFAVDALAAVMVGREVSWFRFAVKCAVSYGPSLVLALLLVRSFMHKGPRDGPAAATSSTRTRMGLAVLALCFAALAAGAVTTTVRYADKIRPLLAGDALPDITLHRLDEFGVAKEKVKLSMFEGKVLVLDFWASWCSPCRRSMPELSKIYDDHKDAGLVVLGVNREPESPSSARKALAEIKPSFDCVIDDRMYGERLGLTTLPTSYIVDKRGVVRHMHLGYTEADVVEGEIKALLAE